MSAVIKPTPGRVVWFYPAHYDGVAQIDGQPLAAVIAGVHNDRLINLACFDAYGNHQQRSNVRLVQPGEEAPYGGGFAEWMPYQISAAGIAPVPVPEPDPEVQTPADPADIFAETDGTSASETGLVSDVSGDLPEDTDAPETAEAQK